MKRVFALIMAVLMLAMSVAGCGSDTPETNAPETQGTEASQETGATLSTTPQQAVGGGYTFPTMPEDTDATDSTGPEEEKPPIVLENFGLIGQKNKIQHKDLKYVMIYNPSVYDENVPLNPTLFTGNFDKQIVVDMDRADGLEEIPENIPMSQKELTTLVPEQELDDNRAVGMVKFYDKGDVETFYTYNSMRMDAPREARKFTCVYSSDYCNIWSYNNSISTKDAQTCGKEFDENIYNQMIEKFGTPRYDSQVNFLYYPMQNGILGCFSGMDLLLEPELPYFGVQNAGCNTGVNLLHLSSLYKPTDPESISTLAHEFQHLICFTNAFGTRQFTTCRTWLNEAMSGYVEEMLYPTIQLHSGRMDQYMDSNLIRYGQSLYNFTTNIDQFAGEWDIGVYGSVYLYSMYLERLAGEDVFAKFHDYWRNSYSMSLHEAEALANAVPEEIYKAVDQSVRYPTAILFNNFATKEEEWMSKLTLQFYLDMLDQDESDPTDFANVIPEQLLYDQLMPASIEGGGRIIVALKDNSYEVPTFAGKGLIYVGLDENFEVLSISYK